MRCPHCNKLLTPSRLAVESHYKKNHPEEYEVVKNKSIENSEKNGRIGFSRDKFMDEGTKYQIMKNVDLKNRIAKAAKDKQNGVKHSRKGTAFFF